MQAPLARSMRVLTLQAFLCLVLTACALDGDGLSRPPEEAARIAAWPAAGVVPSGEDALRATGNEPYWSLHVDGDGLVFRMLGRDDPFVAPAFAMNAVDTGRVYRARTERRRLFATVRDRICRDSMSGMPHPLAVTVSLDGEVFRGCGGEPVSLLRDVDWEVARLDGVALQAEARMILRFGQDRRLSGVTPCSRFDGRYRVTGESLELGEIDTGGRTCPPERAMEEQLLLELLSRTRGFGIEPDGGLRLRTVEGRTLLARPGGKESR